MHACRSQVENGRGRDGKDVFFFGGVDVVCYQGFSFRTEITDLRIDWSWGRLQGILGFG